MKKISEVHEEQFGITLRELGVTEGVIDCLKSQAKSELIDIQIAELEGMKKKDKICKADKSGYSKDLIVYEAIRMENADNIIYNQALEDRIAKLLKQKGEKMSNDRRPEYPRCVMTPEIIRRIRSDQEVWDR